MIKKRFKLIILIPTFFLLISLLYSLAYRYLIERDDGSVINSFSSISDSSNSKNHVTFDDWNYSCDSFSINIEKKKMDLKRIR